MEIFAGIIIVLLFIILVIQLIQIKNNKKNQLKNIEFLKQELTLSLKDSFNDVNNSLNENNKTMLKELSEFKIDLIKSYSQANEQQFKNLNLFKESLLKELINNFNNINEVLEKKLLEINKDMTSQLDKNFNKTNTAFSQMIERLAKIDEAQKKIENLSTNIVSLQDILSDKKTRGTFGEVQLNNILKSVFGEKQDYYKIQAKMSNGTIADALLNIPEPVGSIAIDSKFPLEGYRKMFDNDIDEVSRNQAKKQFKNDIKKHIDDISMKYIVAGQTTNSAIMFLPAEAVFAQINANFQDVIEYANTKKVWLTSPTTLMATLTSIQVIVQNIEQSKYAKIIQEHLLKLNEEFTRYAKRWDNLSRHIDSVNSDAKEIHTTTQKISTEFKRISSVKFEKEGDLIEE